MSSMNRSSGAAGARPTYSTHSSWPTKASIAIEMTDHSERARKPAGTNTASQAGIGLRSLGRRISINRSNNVQLVARSQTAPNDGYRDTSVAREHGLGS